jgi:hypothetical protein
MASSPLGMAPSPLAPSALVKCGAGFPRPLFSGPEFQHSVPRSGQTKTPREAGFCLGARDKRDQTGRQRP